MPQRVAFRSSLEAITFAKRRTLRQLAAMWMRQHDLKASTIRLDAIGVVLLPGNEPLVTHIGAVGLSGFGLCMVGGLGRP